MTQEGGRKMRDRKAPPDGYCGQHRWSKLGVGTGSWLYPTPEAFSKTPDAARMSQHPYPSLIHEVTHLICSVLPGKEWAIPAGGCLSNFLFASETSSSWESRHSVDSEQIRETRFHFGQRLGWDSRLAYSRLALGVGGCWPVTLQLYFTLDKSIPEYLTR